MEFIQYKDESNEAKEEEASIEDEDENWRENKKILQRESCE